MIIVPSSARAQQGSPITGYVFFNAKGSGTYGVVPHFISSGIYRISKRGASYSDPYSGVAILGQYAFLKALRAMADQESQSYLSNDGLVASRHATLQEAIDARSSLIAQWKSFGARVLVVDYDYPPADGETVTTVQTLSRLQWDYFDGGKIPGVQSTSASRTASSSSTSTSASSETSAAQAMENHRLLVKDGRETVARADQAFLDADHALARTLYTRLLNIGVPEWEEYHAHARERLAALDDIENMQALTAFQKGTGLGLGASASGSHFEGDGGIMRLEVTHGLLPGMLGMFAIGTATNTISDTFASDTSLSVNTSGLERTSVVVNVGTSIPFLHLGPLGLHTAYVWQNTNVRSYNLFLGGAHIDLGDGSFVFRFDAIYKYGKPVYGGGMTMRFDL